METGENSANEGIAASEHSFGAVAARHAARKRKIIAIITAGLAVLGACAAVLLTKVVLPARRYSAAEQLLAEEKYDEAAEAFDSLGKYRDCEERKREVLAAKTEAENRAAYEAAGRLFAEGKYREAELAYEKLGDFQDSVEQAKEAWY